MHKLLVIYKNNERRRSNGNLCHPGSVHIKVLPPIRTEGMSKAEQKQLPDAVRQAILAQL